MKPKNPTEKIEQLTRAVPLATYGMRMDLDTPLIVRDPSRYQAFYGILRGDPDVFGIKKEPGLFLDLQILFPECSDSAREITVQIFSGETLLEQFNCRPTGAVQATGDYRFALGKDFRSTIDAKTVTIILRNTNNVGKYVLTVGNTYVAGDFSKEHREINRDFQKSIGPERPWQLHWIVLLALLAIFGYLVAVKTQCFRSTDADHKNGGSNTLSFSRFIRA